MRPWRCWFHHSWRTYQVAVDPAYNEPPFVLAWKQCERCAKSRLIHILR